MRRAVELLLTCEHGGNGVPQQYSLHFAGHEELLSSHRGWDPGALELARAFSRSSGSTLIASTVTRLLIDLNRSPANPTLFSNVTWCWSPEEQRTLIERYHTPHWNRVEHEVGQRIGSGAEVIHLAVHTFTPVLDGIERLLDLGLLYDPARDREAEFMNRFGEKLAAMGDTPAPRIAHNEPYSGVADGLVTVLRSRFTADKYLGLELEVNQKYPIADGREWESLKHHLVENLLSAVEEWRHT